MHRKDKWKRNEIYETNQAINLEKILGHIIKSVEFSKHSSYFSSLLFFLNKDECCN